MTCNESETLKIRSASPTKSDGGRTRPGGPRSALSEIPAGDVAEWQSKRSRVQ